MADFWQIDIGDWHTATDDLTLEQEAALLRVINATRLYNQPIRHNLRVLTGLWRCNERKAKRLLDELMAAGVLMVEDGSIINRRAVEEASKLAQSRVDKQSAGRRGGIESGKSRRKTLENKETGEAPASTIEENRIEENIVGSSSSAREPAHDPPSSQAPVTNVPDEAWALWRAVIRAAGVPEERLPTYWMPPAAVIHVQRWMGMGLTEQEIIDTARQTRANHTDPPKGPKALDGSMQRTAAAKLMPPMMVQEGQKPRFVGGNHVQKSDGAEKMARRADLIKAAARGTT